VQQHDFAVRLATLPHLPHPDRRRPGGDRDALVV